MELIFYSIDGVLRLRYAETMGRRKWLWFLAMIPAGALLGAGIGLFMTLLMPKKYENQAVIEVKPRHFGLSPHFMTGQLDQEEIHRRYVDRTALSILEQQMLENAAQSLGLNRKWDCSLSEAAEIIRSNITIRNLRGSDLFSISVVARDDISARDLSNTIAEIYQTYRQVEEKEFQANQMKLLDQALEEQEAKVEDAREALAKHVRESRLLHTENFEALTNSEYYIESKKNFELELEFLQNLELKKTAEEISRKHLSDVVLIHERAELPSKLISPNLSLNLIAGSVIGAILVPILSLFVMRRRLSARA